MASKVKLKHTEDNHCVTRIHQRGITPQHLNVTVNAFDNWEMQENGRLRLSKRFGVQILDVIVSATTSGATSIDRGVTAFPQDEGKMYS